MKTCRCLLPRQVRSLVLLTIASILPALLKAQDPLADAVDQPALTFTADGWTRSTTSGSSHDLVDCAQRVIPGFSPGSSTLSTTFKFTGGPASFWWQRTGTSAVLKFFVDGVEVAANPAVLTWVQVSFDLTPGSHTLSWELSRTTGAAIIGKVDELVVPVGPPLAFEATDAVVSRSRLAETASNAPAGLEPWKRIFTGAIAASWTVEGLPPGLTYTAAGNQLTISGTHDGVVPPAGVHLVSITAANGNQSLSKVWRLTVLDPPVINAGEISVPRSRLLETPPAQPNGWAPWFHLITGDHVENWWVANLPAGLTYRSTPGLLYIEALHDGTAPAAGAYTLTLNASNAHYSRERSIILNVIEPPVITSGLTATLSRSRLLETSVAATPTWHPFVMYLESTGPATRWKVSGLPPGLSARTVPASSAAIFAQHDGIAPVPGTYEVTIEASNGVGTATATLVLTVTPSPPFLHGTPFQISRHYEYVSRSRLLETAATQPPGWEPWRMDLTAESDATEWSTLSPLPAGIVMDTLRPALAGLHDGTAPAPGTYTFDVSASNDQGTSTGTVRLTVTPDAPAGTGLVVNTLSDQNDDPPGLQVSLREALAAGGTISFNPALDGGVIVLTLGQLSPPVPGAVVDASGLADGLILSGNQATRIFDIPADRSLELRRVTLRDGRANAGGAIRNLGVLTLTDCRLIGNGSESGTAGISGGPGQGGEPGTPGGDGGAIYNSGLLACTRCLFSGNTTGAGGAGGTAGEPNIDSTKGGRGGSGGRGGAVFGAEASITTLTECDFSANRTGPGGGGASRNPAPGGGSAGGGGDGGNGGAVCSTGQLVISASSFSANVTGDGGDPLFLPGAQNVDFDSSGSSGSGSAVWARHLMAVNSTFHANRAGSPGFIGVPYFPSGGAIWARGGQVLHCSLTGNVLPGDLVSGYRAQYLQSAGGYGGGLFAAGPCTVENCIIAQNSANWEAGHDLHGWITLRRANLLGIYDIFPGPLNGTAMSPVAPRMGTFGWHGGYTRSRRPAADSPALHAAAASSVLRDQRGFHRTAGPGPDLGAVEEEVSLSNAVRDLHINRQQDGTILLRWQGSQSHAAALEFSAALQLPWTSLGFTFDAATGACAATDLSAPGAQQRFYQVRAMPP